MKKPNVFSSVNEILEADNNTVAAVMVEETNKRLPMLNHIPRMIESTDELSPSQKKYALAASFIITNFTEYCESAEFAKNKCRAQEKFVELYNLGAYPEQLEIIGKKDIQTIRRWKTKYEKSGKDYRVLAPGYHKDKYSTVPLLQAQFLVRLALDPRRRPIAEIAREAREVFVMRNEEIILDKKTYARYLDLFKKEYRAVWGFYREGEAYLDKNELPFAERDWDLIEVGDILFSDGHKLNFTITDPITKRPKRMNLLGFQDARSRVLVGWDIDYSENTLSIALALRRAILTLGKIPKIIYIDNGKAFRSNFFNGQDLSIFAGLFARIGIRVIFAKPYHPQSKTIEPYWHVMAELERLMPTYTGTSIEMKPAYTKRGEKLHSRIHEKFMNGLSVDIFQAHQAIAWWVDNWSKRKQESGHLKGIRPKDVFDQGRGEGIDPKMLTFLMMEEKVGRVERNGIRIFGQPYYSEELFGKEWTNVMIRYDLLYKDSIFVYDENGKFITEAFPLNKLHPAAKILGTEEDVKNVKDFLTIKSKLKKSITHDAQKILTEEIAPAVRRQISERNIYQLEQNETEQIKNEIIPKSRKKKNISDSWGMPDDVPEKNIDTISKIA
jgi:putative transposase